MMSESNQVSPTASYDDQMTLREIFLTLWAGKWLVGGVTFVVTVIAIVVALMQPNIYRAEALLAPNNQKEAGGLSALAAQYGGLASLAGINIGGGSTEATTLGLEILKSRRFVSDFVERHSILVPLMASTGWVVETRDLIIDPRVYDVATATWVREVSPPRKPKPSSQEAYKAFADVFSVSQDKKSGLVTLAVEHYSPDIAKQWVDWLVEDINSAVMRQDVEKAEQAIEYLHKQISSTSLADLQSVFFRLIEEQTKTVMLAEVSPEYLFKTLDPAIAPELKYKPKRAFIAILGMILGGMIGVVVLILKNGLAPRRE